MGFLTTGLDGGLYNTVHSLNWNKARLQNNGIGGLDQLNFYLGQPPAHVRGVYIIGNLKAKQQVRVGSGNIASRLADHRNDPTITEHGTNLVAHWAHVGERYIEGVERYLFDYLNPYVGVRAPDVRPIMVYLPPDVHPFFE